MADPREDDLVETDGVESAAPRRGASAQFVVDSRPGEAAALREAMNPANQSLGEALRLTFRVLQVVIVVLIVLFIFSGFRSVQEGSTGVKTLFGAIYSGGGEEALSPGPVLFWPYPAGETITFPVKRTVDLGDAYWPRLKDPTKRIDELADTASPSDPIVPGQDGSLLTHEGDIFHMKVTAEYVVSDPRRLVETYRPEDADDVVLAALRRGVVQTAASFSLTQLAQSQIEATEGIKLIAQGMLDSLACGLRIEQVNILDRTPPLAIRKANLDVQQAVEDAKGAREQARQEAEKRLNKVAGPEYATYSRLIDQYEAAVELNDQVEADRLLTEIGAAFESHEAAGDVSRVVAAARGYRATIQNALGGDAERFQSLLPEWKENPGLLISQLWYDALSQINGKPDAEFLVVPLAVGNVHITVPTSRAVWDVRRKANLDQRKAITDFSGSRDTYTIPGKDINVGGRGERDPGRRLNPDATSPQKN